MGLPVKEGLVRLVNFKPIFVDSQSPDFCVKRWSWEPQLGRRTIWPGDTARTFCQCGLDHFLFLPLRCAGQYPLRLAGRGTGSWSAGLARWRCREPSRQLYIGARVLRVLSLEPLHPLQLRDAHPAVLRLPDEVGRTADPMLPGQLAKCDSGFAFLQDRNESVTR